MKRKTMILVAVMLGVLLAGCGTIHPQKQWAIGAGMYNGTMTTLTHLKKMDYLSDEDKAAIEPFRVAAREALAQMEAAAFAVPPLPIDTPWGIASTALAVLMKWVEAAEPPEPPEGGDR